ncbi:MAG: hypothetical protein Q8S21_03600 [Candidatus Paracaedibacteraceae bacterium]|nr:hypothetical protein [Candidatus Paracaedibacteraceae bacterium]
MHLTAYACIESAHTTFESLHLKSFESLRRCTPEEATCEYNKIRFVLSNIKNKISQHESYFKMIKYREKTERFSFSTKVNAQSCAMKEKIERLKNDLSANQASYESYTQLLLAFDTRIGLFVATEDTRICSGSNYNLYVPKGSEEISIDKLLNDELSWLADYEAFELNQAEANLLFQQKLKNYYDEYGFLEDPIYNSNYLKPIYYVDAYTRKDVYQLLIDRKKPTYVAQKEVLDREITEKEAALQKMQDDLKKLQKSQTEKTTNLREHAIMLICQKSGLDLYQVEKLHECFSFYVSAFKEEQMSEVEYFNKNLQQSLSSFSKSTLQWLQKIIIDHEKSEEEDYVIVDEPRRSERIAE